MIELNTREYTYKDFCTELGWRIQSGGNETKKKQIRTIEESFEFYHPINPKTKKKRNLISLLSKLKTLY